MKPCRWSDVLHLHTLDVDLLIPESTEALITTNVSLLELVVGGRPRPTKDDDPVLEHATLSKGSEPLCLDELVGVDILPRGFASRHEEDVVAHEGSRV